MQNMETCAERVTQDARVIGEQIRKARVARGWTQAQLAFRAGLRESAICKYERGYFEPRINTLRKIAKALGVTTDYLLGDDEGGAQ